MTAPKRLLVVDDHPLVRAGLRAIFENISDFEVTGSAASASEAIDLVDTLLPDLVISDLTLLDRSGLELIKDLKVRHPGIPVLILSMHDEKIYAERVLRAGGRGYLMKDTPPDQIVEGARTILRGGICVSTETTNRFLESLADGVTKAKMSFPMERLTDREIEVFELMGEGKNSHEIASQLNVSPRTVDTHRTQIRTKLRLADSNAVLAHAIRWKESASASQDQ